jgi:hypothetical protein
MVVGRLAVAVLNTTATQAEAVRQQRAVAVDMLVVTAADMLVAAVGMKAAE